MALLPLVARRGEDGDLEDLLVRLQLHHRRGQPSRALGQQHAPAVSKLAAQLDRVVVDLNLPQDALGLLPARPFAAQRAAQTRRAWHIKTVASEAVERRLLARAPFRPFPCPR